MYHSPQIFEAFHLMYEVIYRCSKCQLFAFINIEADTRTMLPNSTVYAISHWLVWLENSCKEEEKNTSVVLLCFCFYLLGYQLTILAGDLGWHYVGTKLQKESNKKHRLLSLLFLYI